MNTRRKAVSLGAAGLALCMCVTLGACEGQLPEPVQATASASASPNLTTEQEKAIRKQLLEAIEQCNNAKSADGLDRAMSGPELEIRRSELAVAQKTGNLDPKTDIPDAITQTIIPTDSGWPRSVFTITTTTQDQQSKRLLVFDQESARQNYKLWGVARLFQGVQMPKFTVPQIGAQMGTVQSALIEKVFTDSELFELDTYPSLAMEVVNGNIVGFVCDYAVGMGMVASNDKLEAANFTFSDDVATFGKACVIAKGNDDLLEVVNTVIDRVVEDGSYLEKFNEYNAIWSGEAAE